MDLNNVLYWASHNPKINSHYFFGTKTSAVWTITAGYTFQSEKSVHYFLGGKRRSEFMVRALYGSV